MRKNDLFLILITVGMAVWVKVHKESFIAVFGGLLIGFRDYVAASFGVSV